MKGGSQKLFLLVWILSIAVSVAKLSNSLVDDDFEADSILSYGSLESPFRMQKLNLLWDKARAKLAETKLRKLFSELKIQDKEHLDLKRLKADNLDKDGLREAEIRKKFNGIMYDYGLVQSDESLVKDIQNQTGRSSIFKDKKLEKLWFKAQKAGLTEEELMILKSEFLHHQEKVDEYHRLQEIALASRDNSKPNEIKKDTDETPSFLDPNTLDGKSKDLKKNYERLHRIALNSHPKDFEEPKVDGLWRLALDADFSDVELDSIKVELKHYENRIKKLRHLEAELDLVDSRHEKKYEKSDGRRRLDAKLVKRSEEIEKIHADMIGKIAARHSEL